MKTWMRSSSFLPNLQDPVFSRWDTVLAAFEVFVENWAVIDFFAVALKGDNKSGSYKWQLACALVSLMKNKSEPTMEGQSFENFIESFTEDNDSEAETPKLNKGDTPIFEAVLHFLNGFNKAYFKGKKKLCHGFIAISYLCVLTYVFHA